MSEQQVLKKRSLKPFWILLAVSALPYLFGWFYFSNREVLPEVETSNRGELITPVRSIDGLSLQLVDGEALQTASLKGDWILLTAGSTICDENCQRNIYHMTQIRRLMGEERNRIQRLFVVMDNDKLADFQQRISEYGAISLVDSAKADAATLLQQMTINGQSPENRIIIMDPLANLIMIYPVDADPVDIARDFRRLLKVTRIGQPKEAG
jgi:cytochrome oxidase Cu insertion factor (SCO1/SenC/PrrC family)